MMNMIFFVMDSSPLLYNMGKKKEDAPPAPAPNHPGTAFDTLDEF